MRNGTREEAWANVNWLGGRTDAERYEDNEWHRTKWMQSFSYHRGTEQSCGLAKELGPNKMGEMEGVGGLYTVAMVKNDLQKRS